MMGSQSAARETIDSSSTSECDSNFPSERYLRPTSLSSQT
jgi:hypothetical protein